ncbi:hypothetical protein RCC89_09235 [Cytophagaceae bacterium ABcell3]|nr:hypothetical protein RCC89_09235 [Cytophagaceae bacterium ABcell3]
MDNLQQFKEIFWDAFQRPGLKSHKFIAKWQELEPINDQLAGPLFAIYEKGNCDYIFSDNERFPQINKPEDLFERLEKMIHHYHDEVAMAEPKNDIEKEDQQALLFQSDKKMQLAELALLITQNCD